VLRYDPAVSRPDPPLSLADLGALVRGGTVDTVLVAMTDMQGRLQGKRCGATHFLDEVVTHGAEACNYLLGVDVDMATVEGYDLTSWERGYGDFRLCPDLDTLRLVFSVERRSAQAKLAQGGGDVPRPVEFGDGSDDQ